MRASAAAVLLAMTTSSGIAFAGEPIPAPAEATALREKIGQFAPVDLVVNLDELPPNEKASLAKQIEAAKLMNALFLRQVWSGNESMLLDLQADSTLIGKQRLAYFLMMKGPWDRQDEFKIFVAGAPSKPSEGNFYPAGAKKEEIEAWIKGLPDDQKTLAQGFYTTIRRGPDGKLVILPYSEEYQGELSIAAGLLRDAAGLTQQPTLKAFLNKRADAFLSNDYYDSDVAWMQLDATLEPTIGPYEVYEDDWFNYKAAFESFIAVRDLAETQKLAKFSGQLQDIENHLPIDPKMRNPKLGSLAPIRVVNEVYCSGDADHGVQTAAYNLPNDERVTAKMGSKRVMLKNVQDAKFEKVLIPISKVALAPKDVASVKFEPFFTWILMHELMHGLGPHDITVSGKPTTVRKEMKEAGSAFEEAKADISGLWAMQYLVDKKVLDKSFQQTMYVTYLASAFRSIRFGIVEAHGKGTMMQLNYLVDKGAIVVNADGTYSVVDKKIRKGVEDLTREIMTIQAHGDYDAAKAMLAKYGVVRPEVQRVLDRLKDVPIDIAPSFVTADQLLGKQPTPPRM